MAKQTHGTAFSKQFVLALLTGGVDYLSSTDQVTRDFFKGAITRKGIYRPDFERDPEHDGRYWRDYVGDFQDAIHFDSRTFRDVGLPLALLLSTVSAFGELVRQKNHDLNEAYSFDDT